MNSNPTSESKLELLQAAEKKRKSIESHVLKASGDLKDLFRGLQTYLAELEYQNEELRQSNSGLSELHQRYLEVYQRAPLGYLVLLPNGIVMDANPAGLRLLGLERNQIVGRSFGRFVQPECHDRLFKHLAQTLASGTKSSIELKLLVGEDTTPCVLMESAAVQAQDGSADSIYSLLVDVGERYWALEKLSASEEKYRLLFREMVSGAMMVDIISWDEYGNPADALILDVNPAFESLTGIARDSAVGRRILELFPQTEKYWFEALADTPRLGRPSRIEAYHSQLGKYFSLRAFGSKQGPVFITGLDITDQEKSEASLGQAREELEKRITERTSELTASIQALESQIEKREQAEKELKQANEQLQARADQLRELTGELTMAEQRERRRVSRLLHDGLQQHLVSARMRMGVVRDEIEGAELKYELDKIGQLIGDAVQMARSLSVSLSPPVLHTEGLSAGLNWLASWMQEKHHFNVDLCLEEECDLPRDVLIMVFESVRELLFNAAKHARVSSAHVRLQRTEENQIELSVRDEGVGFDPARVSAAGGQNRGLGLFSIRDRINLIGGNFYIDSVLGKGSRLTMVIPCASAASIKPHPR